MATNEIELIIITYSIIIIGIRLTIRIALSIFVADLANLGHHNSNQDDYNKAAENSMEIITLIIMNCRRIRCRSRFDCRSRRQRLNGTLRQSSSSAEARRPSCLCVSRRRPMGVLLLIDFEDHGRILRSGEAFGRPAGQP